MTPEEVAENERKAAEVDAKIAALKWQDIPRGHYAVEIVDLLGDDYASPPIGYLLFERQAARLTKTGRIIGRDGLRTQIVGANGHTGIEASEYLDREAVNFWSGRAEQWQMHLVAMIWRGEDARRLFGVVTGRCAWCGKPLTDPESKMRGIGPDCFASLGL
jgi:uncharacterized protein DUF6011